MQAGVSSLGVTLSYGTESTAGTKPASFAVLHRINSIGGIALSAETIDASALEDLIERSISGRQTTGGNFPVTINVTDSTVGEWEAVITAYAALTGGKRMWFQIVDPDLTKSFFIVAQPPKNIPMPSFDQNSLLTVELTLTIEEYIGMDTKVVPTDSENQ